MKKVVGGVLIACILLAAVIIGTGDDSADQAISSAQSADTQKPAEVFRQKVGFGEPVELAGMTFVVEKLAVLPSIPIPSEYTLHTQSADDFPQGKPLEPPAGMRFWVLTVSVRNDEETPATEPFCHVEPPLPPFGGAVLEGKRRWVKSPSASVPITRRGYSWWNKGTWLMDAKHQLCYDIQPGSTETFQLVFVISKRNPKIDRVFVSHRSAATRHYPNAYVAV